MSLCECQIDIDVDHLPGFQKITECTAKKLHKCGECDRDIILGESCFYTASKSDGHFWTFKTCADCESIRDALYCGGWEYGELFTEVWNHITEGSKIPDDCLLAMTPDARGNVCNMIQEYWDEWCNDEDES